MTDNTIQWSERDGVVTLTLDDPSQTVNTVNAAYASSMDSALERLTAMGGELRGVIVTSGKSTFFAGGDLNDLLAATAQEADQLTEFANGVKAQLRRLETLGAPVVAAINGSALGGGLELALACHHRIALNRSDIRIGLPEVTLGLLPGGGGVVRSVRLLGLGAALDEVLLSGAAHRPPAALALRLIDELADDTADLLTRAATWIDEHPEARQPWDLDDQIPGGAANTPAVEVTLAGRTAALRARHRGAPMPAPAALLAAAVESTQVDFDTALAVETRYFVKLATGPVAKNIIQGTFFDRQRVHSGASRPANVPTHQAHRVAVLGAGMMGAGIALTAALSGLAVHLKDVDVARAEKGKAYAQKVLGKQVESGRRSAADAEAVLARITLTDSAADLADADLVIEAVFEDPELKAKVFAEVIDVVNPDALLASNTSTLPITGLAESTNRPADFIGMHFFSPVERMELLEIVVGAQTSDATIAKAFDVARQLGKTPIVVNDGRGFFTSRVILSRLLEAAAMLGEGIAPASIEQASLQAGYPVGTLALLDELTLTLPHTIFGQFRDDALKRSAPFVDHPGDSVLETMIACSRLGRSAGAGFYEYHDNRRGSWWPQLPEKFGPLRPADDLSELIDRLLFTEALDTARCLEQGLLRSTADANVGSMLGIGYPTWTGGAAQFIDGYPGGLGAFLDRARHLEDRFGPRFAPPPRLLDGATAGAHA